MAQNEAYRVYPLDASGRITGVEVIEAGDDDAALAAGRALMAERGVEAFEIWRGARRVFPPVGPD